MGKLGKRLTSRPLTLIVVPSAVSEPVCSFKMILPSRGMVMPKLGGGAALTGISGARGMNALGWMTSLPNVVLFVLDAVAAVPVLVVSILMASAVIRPLRKETPPRWAFSLMESEAALLAIVTVEPMASTWPRPVRSKDPTAVVVWDWLVSQPK